MSSVNFPFNTIVVCYNCRIQGVGYLPGRGESTVLNMIFIACGVCVRYPHVHNPGTALIRRYIDVQRYSDTIEFCRKMFHCTPTIFKERRFFSITRLRTKTVTRIENSEEIADLLGGLFAILDNDEGCKFFSGEAARPTTRVNLAISTNHPPPMPSENTEHDLIQIPELMGVPPPYSTNQEKTIGD
jgi:hypothetical protein